MCNDLSYDNIIAELNQELSVEDKVVLILSNW